MHYKNGRKAELGDQIVGKDCGGKAIGGVLVSAIQNSTTCNGMLVPQQIIDVNQRCVTLGECLHIDDFDNLASGATDKTDPGDQGKTDGSNG